MDGATQQRLRGAFRYVNRAMVVLWRLGLGRLVNVWPSGSGRIMVITHTGRRSGRRFRTPLNYAEIDEDVYCTAGFGTGTDWYRNVLADPMVEVWLPGRRWRGRVEDVDASPERTRLLREVLLASGFAAPAAGVRVRRLSDEELAAATTGYRLLRIRRQGSAEGSPRPGDLAWTWSVAALVGVVIVALVRRRDLPVIRDR